MEDLQLQERSRKFQHWTARRFWNEPLSLIVRFASKFVFESHFLSLYSGHCEVFLLKIAIKGVNVLIILTIWDLFLHQPYSNSVTFKLSSWKYSISNTPIFWVVHESGSIIGFYFETNQNSRFRCWSLTLRLPKIGWWTLTRFGLIIIPDDG